MTDDDSPDWFGDYSDNYVKIDVGFYEVLARNDDATLEELEEAAYRLSEHAEEVVGRLGDKTDPNGMHH